MTIISRGVTPRAGFWIGAGLVLLAPVVGPALGNASKSMTKAAIIGGLRAYRKLKASSIAAVDTMVELYEEAAAELTEQK